MTSFILNTVARFFFLSLSLLSLSCSTKWREKKGREMATNRFSPYIRIYYWLNPNLCIYWTFMLLAKTTNNNNIVCVVCVSFICLKKELCGFSSRIYHFIKFKHLSPFSQFIRMCVGQLSAQHLRKLHFFQLKLDGRYYHSYSTQMNCTLDCRSQSLRSIMINRAMMAICGAVLLW